MLIDQETNEKSSFCWSAKKISLKIFCIDGQGKQWESFFLLIWRRGARKFCDVKKDLGIGFSSLISCDNRARRYQPRAGTHTDFKLPTDISSFFIFIQSLSWCLQLSQGFLVFYFYFSFFISIFFNNLNISEMGGPQYLKKKRRENLFW